MSNVDNDLLWCDMMDYMRRQHGSICRQWFDQLRPDEFETGLLKIHTTNHVQKNYLQKRCLKQFTEAAQAATGALVAVKFVDSTRTPVPARSKSSLTAPVLSPAQPPIPTKAVTPESPVPPARPADDDWLFDQTVISPDYRFDNFVTGPENALAYSAAVAIANQPGTTYNPLFIHGGVGLGKTHLLQAICQSILNTAPQMRICYLSCDAFVNQFLDSVQHGQMAQFRHRYRHVDMLVIDDIHFLANRERTQEEFFHTFNELYQLNRQIVLSSDSPPNELPQLEERLISRFQVGLVAPVSRLHFETRVAIVRAKAELRGVELPDDVIAFIATKIDSNARELEGAVTTLQGHSSLHQGHIDIELARKTLGEPASDSPSNQATLQHLIDVVTTFFNVRLSDLQSKRRQKSITEPRQICMWLARRYTRFSLEDIGGYFGGRDHTTVMHSIRMVDQRIASDTAFSKQLEHLQTQVAGATP